MRILFAASPRIAVPALEAVFELCGGGEGFELAGLLTNPDSPKGRSGASEPTEAAIAAMRFPARAGQSGAQSAAAGSPPPAGAVPPTEAVPPADAAPPTEAAPPFPILKPEKLDAHAREQAAALKPDILVSFAYGRIFGPQFLALFPMGGINIHPSLLPRYRGPTPIPAAIINGDDETGITIQRLALEMDSGDILLQERVPLDGRETTGSLSERMAKKAAELLPLVLRGIAAGTVRPQPQNHQEASYCSLIKKEDGIIDWSLSAADIDARIRAYDPWPLSWTTHGDQQLFILKAAPQNNVAPQNNATPQGNVAPQGNGGALMGNVAPPGQVLGIDKQTGILIQTGDGALAVTALQYRTKKPLEWRAFINGARNFSGSRLG